MEKAYEINIDGVIGTVDKEDEKEYLKPTLSYTYADFKADIALFGAFPYDSLVVNIRSYGGSMQDALLMYSHLIGLRKSGVEVTTRCFGSVASAATMIAQAGGVREVSAYGLYLIHCARQDLYISTTKKIAFCNIELEKSDKSIVQLYSDRSGKTFEEISELMNRNNGEGEWLTAQEAIDFGLADKKIDELINITTENE